MKNLKCIKSNCFLYENGECDLDINFGNECKIIDYTKNLELELKKYNELSIVIEERNLYNYCKEIIDSWPEWKKEIARKNYDYKD